MNIAAQYQTRELPENDWNKIFDDYLVIKRSALRAISQNSITRYDRINRYRKDLYYILDNANDRWLQYTLNSMNWVKQSILRSLKVEWTQWFINFNQEKCKV